MIRVALEISTLGLAELNRWAGYNRIGIYRVIDELTKDMLGQPNVDTSLLFWDFPFTSTLGSIYFKNLGYNAIAIKKNFATEDKLYQKLRHYSGFSNRFTVLNLLSKFLRQFKTKNDLKEIYTIHSLYYQIPSLKNIFNKLRFKTIYDIFPLIHTLPPYSFVNTITG